MAPPAVWMVPEKPVDAPTLDIGVLPCLHYRLARGKRNAGLNSRNCLYSIRIRPDCSNTWRMLF